MEDTIIYYPGIAKGDTGNVYFLSYYNQLKLKPQVISQSIFFNKGDLYRLNDISQTNRKLSRYPITRMVNISLSEANVPMADSSQSSGLLDCNILISRSPVNTFSIETDLTNSAGNPGMAASVVYQNKNIFRGGELFRIKVRGALELQSSVETTNKFFFFKRRE